MLKIHHTFTLQFLGLFLLTGIIASAIGYFTLKESVISDYEARLKQKIGVIEYTLQSATDLETSVTALAQRMDKRITVIRNNFV